MFDHILVPLDRSALAECVLPHVGAMAGAFGSRITLLHVIEARQDAGIATPINPLEWQFRRSEAECYLLEVAQRLAGEGLIVSQRVAEGPAAEQIVDVAHAEHADLILCSSHGHSGLSPWPVSSVVQKVAMRAYTSLMIVRAHRTRCDIGSSQTTDFPYKRVLVPMDGSQRAEYVLPAATRLAMYGAQIMLVHVVQRPEMPRRTPLTRADSELADRYITSNRTEAEQYLNELRSRLPGDVETRLVVGEHVGRTLHDLAHQADVDLVLVSAHGYSGQSHWPFGSIVHSFITFGHTNVLIVQDAQPPLASAFAMVAAQPRAVRQPLGFRNLRM